MVNAGVNAGVPLVPGCAGMPEPVPGVKDFHIGRQGDIWETVFAQEGFGGQCHAMAIPYRRRLSFEAEGNITGHWTNIR
jgi:hypothetical protein